jgi:hypothetical protein
MSAYPNFALNKSPFAQGEVVELHVCVDGGPTKRVRGRDAWLLKRLIDAGDRGVTTIELPAPRVSHYLWKLRQAGISIETIREAHDGPFAGQHGRFRLTCSVVINAVIRK